MALVAVAVSEFDSVVLVFVVAVGVVCRRRRVGSVVFGVVEFALEGVVLVAVAGVVVVVDLMTRKGDPLIPRPPIMMEGPPRPPRPFIVVFLPDCACP